MRWLTLLLLAAPAWATLTADPDIGADGCDSHPCVCTVTCASATCTAGEVTEARNAVASPWCNTRGDTVKYEAGRTFGTGSSPVLVDNVAAGSGYLTITTTQVANLPLDGTRVTPAYAALMPIFQTTDNTKPAIHVVGDGTPAEHVKIRGLWMRSKSAGSQSRGALLIGEFAMDHVLTSINEQPDDVVVQHCLLGGTWGRLELATRTLGVHSRAVLIRDNFIWGPNTSGEGQTIWTLNGCQGCVFENNYIGGAGENFMSGGAQPEIDIEPSGIIFRYNYFPHEEERLRFRPWEAGLFVLTGMMIRKAGAADGRTYIAQDSGTTGGSEPTWPTGTPGDTVADNDITWEYFLASGNAHHTIKNNFEIKCGRDWLIHHNVFDKMWQDGQAYSINLKSANYPETPSPCEGNWPECYKARTENVFLHHNIVRHTSGVMNLAGNQGTATVNANYQIEHNLALDVEKTTWGDLHLVTGSTQHSHQLVETRSPGVRIEHNTTIATGIAEVNTGWQGLGVPVARNPFRYNILFDTIDTDQTGGGDVALKYGPCNQSATIDPDCGYHNLFLGIPTTGYTIPPSYVETDENDVDVAFRDPGNTDLTRRSYRLGSGSSYRRTAANGNDFGVNWNQLPMIRNLTVTPLDDKALIAWDLSAPIAQIPCVIEVSATKDFDVVGVADLNPATYTRPDTDRHDRNVVAANRRMAVVGANSALAASTTYYYRLQCGGDVAWYTGAHSETPRSFTTVGALAGTRTITATFNRSGSKTLEYGTSYSRATDTISGGGTDVQTCSGSCQFSFTATRGEVYYYRLQGEGAAANVLAAQ